MSDSDHWRTSSFPLKKRALTWKSHLSKSNFLKNTIKISGSLILTLILINLLKKEFDQFGGEFLEPFPNLIFLGISFFAQFLTTCIRYFRFHLFIKEKLFPMGLYCSAFQNMLNHFLPFRIGDLSIVYLLKKFSGISYKKTLKLFLLQRLWDMFAFIWISIAAYTFKFLDSRYDTFLILGLFVVLVLAPLIAPFPFLFFRNMSLFSSLKDYRWSELAKLNIYHEGLSFILWGAIYLYIYVLLLAFQIPTSILDLIINNFFICLSYMLPINTIMNIGTFEFAWKFGYGSTEFSHPLFGMKLHFILFLFASVQGSISLILLRWRKKDDC